jgi:sugar O-acyltransferase (sialic acid O-acetyltransferase NeuD family)
MPLIDILPISSVIIAGAGGFGIEIFDYLQIEAHTGGPPVAGFIDDDTGILPPVGIDIPILGTVGDFYPQEGQVVIVAISSVKERSAVLSKLWAKGVRMPTFIAPGAIVSPSAKIGRGAIICPLSIVNRDATIGDGVVVNVHCSVGHGAFIGAFSILSPYSALNGNASVGEKCFLGTRATIYPRIAIGNRCVVDSHTGVRFPAEDRKLISSRGNYQVSELRTI